MPLITVFEVYPEGTINKRPPVPSGRIPNVEPEDVGVGYEPAVPKLVGNVVNDGPSYCSTVTLGPIAQIAWVAWSPEPRVWVAPKDSESKLKLPEPFHITSGPTCETVTLKLPDAPDVGVGVGVGVLVGLGVGVFVAVGVGVTVLVGVGVGVTSKNLVYVEL